MAFKIRVDEKNYLDAQIILTIQPDNPVFSVYANNISAFKRVSWCSISISRILEIAQFKTYSLQDEVLVCIYFGSRAGSSGELIS